MTGLILRRGLHLVALISAIAVSIALPALPSTATAATSGSIDSPFALKLISTQKLDSRLYELVFSTPALSGQSHVRILLPAGYASVPSRRYPVLYLLHGCCDNYKSWTAEGNAEALTAGLPVIVVMPDGGEAGEYVDWYNNGAGGPPMWETYHIDELLPWIDRHYRTIANRDGRAIAGLSMGGFGAMSYAARHPDLFVSASSFSGAVDNMDPEFGDAEYAFPPLDGGVPDAYWGPQQTQEVRWRGSNPVDLANNLRHTVLTIRTGNGLPGGPYNETPDAIEVAVHHMSEILEQTLNSLGIPSTYQDYGPGSHSWPYWQRDLRLTLPTIMKTFAHPPAHPKQVTYTSIEPAYSVFGWSVNMKRSVLEFSTLANASKSRFTVSGSGTAVVTTPRYYLAGRRYRVTVNNENGTRSFVATAGPDRRLTLLTPLGPSNSYQEFTPQAEAFGTSIEHATVRIVGPIRNAQRRPPRHEARARR